MTVAAKAAAALVVVVVVDEKDEQEPEEGVTFPSAADNILSRVLGQEGQGIQQK